MEWNGDRSHVSPLKNVVSTITKTSSFKKHQKTDNKRKVYTCFWWNKPNFCLSFIMYLLICFLRIVLFLQKHARTCELSNNKKRKPEETILVIKFSWKNKITRQNTIHEYQWLLFPVSFQSCKSTPTHQTYLKGIVAKPKKKKKLLSTSFENQLEQHLH